MSRRSRSPDKHIKKTDSLRILKDNDNLDLSSYKPYIKDFSNFSSHLFDFGEASIFKIAEKNKNEVPDSSPKRTTKREYDLALR